MPIYEYKCKKCQAEFELLITNRDQLVKCSKCGSKGVEKLLSGFAASVKSGKAKSCSISECASCCPSGSCGHKH